jgi:uncharacterized protein (DUF1697 family)
MIYAAFLRGINVNGRKVLKEDLKACFESLGFTEVKTFLQGGSVTFETSATETGQLKELIDQSASSQLSMPIISFVYRLDDIRQLIEAYPFERSADRHAYAVLSDGQIGYLLDVWTDTEVDWVAPTNLGFYWSVPKGLTLESGFAKIMAGKKIAEHTTTRKLNTLTKMVV